MVRNRPRLGFFFLHYLPTYQLLPTNHFLKPVFTDIEDPFFVENSNQFLNFENTRIVHTQKLFKLNYHWGVFFFENWLTTRIKKKNASKALLFLTFNYTYVFYDFFFQSNQNIISKKTKGFFLTQKLKINFWFTLFGFKSFLFFLNTFWFGFKLTNFFFSILYIIWFSSWRFKYYRTVNQPFLQLNIIKTTQRVQTPLIRNDLFFYKTVTYWKRKKHQYFFSYIHKTKTDIRLREIFYTKNLRQQFITVKNIKKRFNLRFCFVLVLFFFLHNVLWNCLQTYRLFVNLILQNTVCVLICAII